MNMESLRTWWSSYVSGFNETVTSVELSTDLTWLCTQAVLFFHFKYHIPSCPVQSVSSRGSTDDVELFMQVWKPKGVVDTQRVDEV